MRTLTVSKMWRAPRTAFGCGRTVPFLRLSGRWLEKAGIPAGSRVRVELRAGSLVLSPVSAPEVAPAP